MSRTLAPRAARTAGTLVLAAVALAACSRLPEPEGAPARSLSGADPIVRSVQPAAAGVRVIARVDAPDLAGDTVRAASRAARQIARAAQAGAADLPAGARMVTLELYGVDVDKFGKRSPGRLFAVDFDVADLKVLDLKALGPAKVMNRATDLRIDPPGEVPVAAWCMRYPHAGGDFCAMAGN